MGLAKLAKRKIGATANPDCDRYENGFGYMSIFIMVINQEAEPVWQA